MPEEVGRRLVHEMRVFNGDQTRLGQQMGQESDDHLGQLRVPELLFQLLRLYGLRHGHVDCHTDEWGP